MSSSDLKAFLPELRTALAVPLIGIIEENEQRYRSLEKPLTSLGLADEDGLNAIGARLLGHRVIGSYRNLSYSYEEAINHLTEVIENPQTMQFGGSLARNEKRNALSSNELIANVVPRLATYLQRAARTRLVDFGSGGGHFAAGIGMETILFDRSAIANQEALQTFAVRPELIKGMVTGSILDLEKMKEAKQAKPDVATINYILHDILGQPESFAEGVSLVKEFLLNYREVFGQMPLLITESWDVSWDHLREANKPYITLFQWLHEISPQRLMDGGTLADILIECEFMIREVIDHGFLPINGEQVPVNQTLVAVAQ